jgi:signal peptidase I
MAEPIEGSSDTLVRPSEALGDTPPQGKSLLREYAEALTIALLLALVVRSSVVQAFKIPSGSMLPTLQVGDHILVNKLAYRVRLPFLGTVLMERSGPERYDVVVFVYPVDPTKDYVKRVIGVAGDVVMIRNKRVYINGTLWNDPRANFLDGDKMVFGGSARDNFGPVTVPAGHVFVLGDNRDHSYDSRFWGFVDNRDIYGRAFLVYWSWDSGDNGVRWRRLGTLIQ